jgi:hypothetical protein
VGEGLLLPVTNQLEKDVLKETATSKTYDFLVSNKSVL